MLWGIQNGWLRRNHGIAGRSLLGYQTIRALGTPPVGSYSFKTHFAPNAVDGDVYINSVWADTYALEVRQDGTFYYNANNDSSRHFVLADLLSMATGLNGEGILAVNDTAPSPVNGSYFGNGTLAFGQPQSLQLKATDPQGDGVTFSLQGGAFPPGLSLSSSGLVTGTPNALGSYGFVIRVVDPYGAFTDSSETVTIAVVLANYVGKLYADAAATLLSLGFSSTQTPTASALPATTIISQNPVAGTVITTALVVAFTTSDGSESTGNVNVFPATLKGITWAGTRSMIFNSSYQEAVSGKVSTITYQQYPIIEWDLNYELLDQSQALDELRSIAGLFSAKQAQSGTFLYTDPAFNSVMNDQFGVGNRTNNLLPNSNGMTSSYWSAFGLTVTNAPDIAPDGTPSAWQITATGNSNWLASAPVLAQVTGSTQYTYSMWARSVSGIQYFGMDVQNQSATVLGILEFTATTAWQRFQITVTTLPGDTGVYVQFGNGSNYGFGAGSVIEVFGAQFETGATPTTYIPTTSAITKSFQLIAHYGNTGGPSIAEMVQNLTPAAPFIYKNGVLLTAGTDYNISTTGIVNFAIAPLVGDVLTWTGGFYYLCRFETDDLSPDQFMANFWNLKSLKLRSVII